MYSQIDFNRQLRQENFKDHCEFIENNEYLKKSIQWSINNSVVIIDEIGDLPVDNYKKYNHTDANVPNIHICPQRSFKSVQEYKKTLKLRGEMDNNIYCVLNFASPTNPGGQVVGGSSAQEEALCRCSTLYQVISNSKFKRDYYHYHKRNRSVLYDDRLIYSPSIVVTSDDIPLPTHMNSEDWYHVDIITCPAPNLIPIYKGIQNPISNDVLMDTYVNRIRQIIKAAIINHVDILVLGAWGCGVFRNDPTSIALAFKKVLINEGYCKYFKDVIFAIVDDSRGRGNISAFTNILGYDR